ncbi:ribosome small subunit-dependent GTPase A [Marinilabiliaceae bacterium ANBcel2]|nr:ribosome small subunit-dependent GTPase A [Marinilabiliaceae bacterium ANBcel2]
MEKGVVIKSTGSWYHVRTVAGELYHCSIKGKLRLDKLKSTNPVAVGDNVEFEVDNHSSTGVISSVCERKNYIIRKSTNLSKQTHILAANIDQAVLLVTVNYPVTTTVFIDRFLASAEAFDIPVVIIFNKIDRYDKAHIKRVEELKSIYQSIEYPVMQLSAKTDQNFDQVMALFKERVSLIAGHSGVGKSTLINRLEPELNLKTREISSAHQTGKHTTTFAEMHPFSFGGYVIDTPGIRGFGLAMIEKEELNYYFREIFKASLGCRFHNCTHIHEPHCAVKEAVKEGYIAESRYNSYINIFLNKDEKYR